MLTPRFKLDQDDKFVTVSIYAPFTHVAETEVFMDGTDFRFFSKPYFLRLHFPHEIIENDDASANFDAESLSYVIKCPKVNHGQFFPNLDMISELCKPKGSNNVSNIEVLNDGQENEGSDEEEEEWYFEQVVPKEPENDDCSAKGYGIGFGQKHEKVFTKLLEESQEILDVKNPDTLSTSKRKELRLEQECKDFDPDHYLSDLYEPDDMIDEVLRFSFSLASLVLDSEDSAKLVEYAKKDRKLKSKSKLRTFCGLLDILFAYCYDNRVTFGEKSSESGWTISKLSSTLVCSDVFESLKETVIASSRRSLVYPIYRHFDLTKKVWADVCSLLNKRTSIIKVLLDLTNIFNESEGRYIFNQLYIDQYVAWSQTLKEAQLTKIANEVSQIVDSLQKDDLNLEIVELEEAAEMVRQEEQEEKLVKSMKNVEISERKAETDDSDDDSSSSSDSDSSSSDSSSSDDEKCEN